MELNQNNPGVFIDDILVDLTSQMLILRPGSLVAGNGSSASIEYLDFMITPRGYASKYSIDEQER